MKIVYTLLSIYLGYLIYFPLFSFEERIVDFISFFFGVSSIYIPFFLLAHALFLFWEKRKGFALIIIFFSLSLRDMLLDLSESSLVSEKVFLIYAIPTIFLLIFLYRYFVKEVNNLYILLCSILSYILIGIGHYLVPYERLFLIKKALFLSLNHTSTGLVSGILLSNIFLITSSKLWLHLSFIILFAISFIYVTKDLFRYIVNKVSTLFKKPILTIAIEKPVKEKSEKEEKKSEKLEKEEREENEIDKIFKVSSAKIAFKDKIQGFVQAKSIALEKVLAEHGIESKVVNTVTGPAVTRFELSISQGTRVKKVVSLSDDIAMSLAAKSVRIEAPIPGKSVIGIEIPNEESEDIYFGSILQKRSSNPLDIVIGKNIVGDEIIVDLRRMPHLLVAGRTGSGKSVCINVIIASIIARAKPEDVKFIMVDPKMVELMPYNGIGHLYIPVITDPKLAANALAWAVDEMERRYALLAELSVRNLESYNTKAEKLPYIVVIIDELADLMMTAPASIEASIARIAQKARAVGIHLIVATQRPTIDVITGTIKANLPSRISFAVASQIDSRTILDSTGAEKLLGRGDLLFLESGKANLVRIQGAYVSDDEVNALASILRKRYKPTYMNEILIEKEEDDRDELFERALEVIQESGKPSATLLQRKLKVGYARAARIMDQLEEHGIVKKNENGEKELDENQ